MIAEYKCTTCGKNFSTKQALCGHQRVHSINFEDSKLKIKENHLQLKLDELNQWVIEEHKCKKCGTVMIEKYGSGNYCSRECANSHTRTYESKLKTRLILKTTFAKKGIKLQNIDNYNLNPKHCQICDKVIDYDHRNCATCGGIECVNKLLSLKAIDRIGKNGLHRNVIDKRYKYGTYKGFQCDSSWELAFLLWHLDNNIDIVRNVEHFSYIYNDSEHNYFPDFKINNDYFEIKGYFRDEMYSKIEYFPKNKVLHIIGNKEIRKYIKYAEDTYGKDFYRIYDRNHPSWMDKINAE